MLIDFLLSLEFCIQAATKQSGVIIGFVENSQVLNVLESD